MKKPSPSLIQAPGLYLVSGPNGSGKTRLVSQWVQAAPGSQLISAETQQQFYEQELARDDRNFNQGVTTSVRVRELLGERGRAHPLYASWNLQGLEERAYPHLSTGESRKVLLLQAVLRDPPLLVLDEPFDGLDVQSRSELWEGIQQLAVTRPVILVSQLSSEPLSREAAAIFSRVFWVEAGKVCWDGGGAEFAQRPVSRRQVNPPPSQESRFVFELDPAAPLIELKNGHIRYEDAVVFEGLNWTVHRGEHTLIEGPNGSGKSSLLELISGDHPQAYDNDLSLFGRKRGTGESVWEIKKKIGLVSGQVHRNYRVGGHVLDVIVSGLYDSIGLYEQPSLQDIARGKEWLTWLDLPVSPETPFRSLSFGFQRLVLIARAAIKIPPLLILDEPTTGLDADNRARVLSLLVSLCAQKQTTVLFVTHLDEERRFWDDRIGGKRLTLSGR